MEENVSTYKFELIVNNYLDPASEGKITRKVNQIERILLVEGEVAARETFTQPSIGELYRLEYLCNRCYGGGLTYPPPADLSWNENSRNA
jgi:hypothetical protein